MTLVRKMMIAAALLAGAGTFAAARADGCYWCKDGSSCKQCRYGSSDSSDARRACESRGCKIGGTMACSSDTNIKMCRAEPPPVVACK